jgi:hypothetical protein
MLLNLLSNAVKFTPEGGRVNVRAMPADGFVEISARLRENQEVGEGMQWCDFGIGCGERRGQPHAIEHIPQDRLNLVGAGGGRMCHTIEPYRFLDRPPGRQSHGKVLLGRATADPNQRA